ncbi:hypothetical protein K469DRAFT_719385 [Zopfia rhizophila CBS 207.26]|uniref:Uncharacterized protein n=1 Tax=Zopfia rhizophila CBS 207.26 TaxID=1314779 RepID=A0A6A6DI23_9PEZI|nr:hypothetical protein K469DRAFT_719385 [Zopfia rhizophila CBS 207.26]
MSAPVDSLPAPPSKMIASNDATDETVPSCEPEEGVNPFITLHSPNKDDSKTEFVDGIMREYWTYPYTVYYPKVGSAPDRPGAFSDRTQGKDVKQPHELKTMDGYPT